MKWKCKEAPLRINSVPVCDHKQGVGVTRRRRPEVVVQKLRKQWYLHFYQVALAYQDGTLASGRNTIAANRQVGNNFSLLSRLWMWFCKKTSPGPLGDPWQQWYLMVKGLRVCAVRVEKLEFLGLEAPVSNQWAIWFNSIWIGRIFLILWNVEIWWLVQK